jgi:hypothetical protein
MPSRKQRRRRQKDRRHEYEYVYVDDTGEEVEPPPEPSEKRATRGRADGKAPRGRDRGAGRTVREPQQPSWNRSLRRAALFFPIFFIVFSLVNKHSAVEWRVVSSLAYSALFIPLTYVMDRTAYRTYLRRTGGTPSRGGKRRS